MKATDMPQPKLFFILAAFMLQIKEGHKILIYTSADLGFWISKTELFVATKTDTRHLRATSLMA